jgi:flagellar motor protein MotB
MRELLRFWKSFLFFVVVPVTAMGSNKEVVLFAKNDPGAKLSTMQMRELGYAFFFDTKVRSVIITSVNTIPQTDFLKCTATTRDVSCTLGDKVASRVFEQTIKPGQSFVEVLFELFLPGTSKTHAQNKAKKYMATERYAKLSSQISGPTLGGGPLANSKKNPTNNGSKRSNPEASSQTTPSEENKLGTKLNTDESSRSETSSRPSGDEAQKVLKDEQKTTPQDEQKNTKNSGDPSEKISQKRTEKLKEKTNQSKREEIHRKARFAPALSWRRLSYESEQSGLTTKSSYKYLILSASYENVFASGDYQLKELEGFYSVPFGAYQVKPLSFNGLMSTHQYKDLPVLFTFDFVHRPVTVWPEIGKKLQGEVLRNIELGVSKDLSWRDLNFSFWLKHGVMGLGSEETKLKKTFALGAKTSYKFRRYILHFGTEWFRLQATGRNGRLEAQGMNFDIGGSYEF